jgi:hypothetical protein
MLRDFKEREGVGINKRGDSLLSYNLYIPTQTKTRARNALPIHKLAFKNTTPHC